MGIELTEHQIETQICHLLWCNKIFFWKNPSGGYFDAKRKVFRKHTNPFALSGAPDLIAVIDGKFIGIEVKSAKGRQSPQQKEFQTKLEKAGAKYFLVRSVEDVKLALYAQ